MKTLLTHLKILHRSQTNITNVLIQLTYILEVIWIYLLQKKQPLQEQQGWQLVKMQAYLCRSLMILERKNHKKPGLTGSNHTHRFPYHFHHWFPLALVLVFLSLLEEDFRISWRFQSYFSTWESCSLAISFCFAMVDLWDILIPRRLRRVKSWLLAPLCNRITEIL